MFFFLMIRRPPRSSLCPCTTRFRSEAAYFVRCGRDTTPQEELERGRLTVVIGFAPLRPAELVALYIHLQLGTDRKSTRLNSSHANISYAVFCLKKKTASHILNIYSQ